MNVFELVGGVIVVATVFGLVVSLIPRVGILIGIAIYLEQVLGVEARGYMLGTADVSIAESIAAIILALAIFVVLIFDIVTISDRYEKFVFLWASEDLEETEDEIA